MGAGNESLLAAFESHDQVTPIYGKRLQKSSSPAAVNRFRRNLACSIGDYGPSQFVQIITLG